MEPRLPRQALPWLLIGGLCVTFLLTYDRLPDHFHRHTRDPAAARLPPAGHGGSAAGEGRRRSRHSGAACRRNASVADAAGFSDLPERLQNFLYYRHCRRFPLLLDLPRKCGGADGSSDVFLLLVIKSLPRNYERRQVLRETWAKERTHNGARIGRVFISGTMGAGLERRRMNELLAVEHRKHGDVLQWDFEESFSNLTLKQVLFLAWLRDRCPRARFLLNGDDDVFAHTDNMVEYLQGVQGGNGGDRHLFVGSVMEGTGPVRDPGSKYFVPVQVQETDTFPAYCSGGGYLLSGHTAAVLYNVSKSVALHPIDDAYMGMCLARAGLRPAPHIGVRPGGLAVPGPDADAYDPCYYKDVLMVHHFLPHQTYVMWEQVHDPALRCWTEAARAPTKRQD